MFEVGSMNIMCTGNRGWIDRSRQLTGTVEEGLKLEDDGGCGSGSGKGTKLKGVSWDPRLFRWGSRLQSFGRVRSAAGISVAMRKQRYKDKGEKAVEKTPRYRCAGRSRV